MKVANMNITLTMFKDLYDNSTDKQHDVGSWSDFIDFLTTLSQRKLKSKADAILISPATYKSNITRCNDAVLCWGGWAALDVDDHDFANANLEERLKEKYGEYSFICHSTASSTIEKPKFRLVFELDRRIDHDQIRNLWYALNTEVGELGDRQTKDLSRMFYTPADYDGANNFLFVNEGTPINTATLISKHPLPSRKRGKNFFDRMPESMQKMFIEHRKNQLSNTSYRWNNYADCPFLSKRALDAYRATTYQKDSGRYLKMYEVMVHVASNAIKKQYPITTCEIVDLCKQLDMDTGHRYKKRAFETEANRAIEYAYRNN
jgi:hypothetical protein